MISCGYLPGFWVNFGVACLHYLDIEQLSRQHCKCVVDGVSCLVNVCSDRVLKLTKCRLCCSTSVTSFSMSWVIIRYLCLLGVKRRWLLIHLMVMGFALCLSA